MSDFFDNPYGSSRALAARPAGYWRLLDRLHDWRRQWGGRLARLRHTAPASPGRRILIVGIEVPNRALDIHHVISRLTRETRHHVSTSIVVMGNRGKFANIDEAIRQAEPLSNFDWLIVTDDDIDFAGGFLDDLIMLAEAGNLSLAQPAHAFHSHTSFAITKRRWGSLVRQTRFVEIGPLTLIRADIFDRIVPFPESRWCYGIDLVWSEVLRRDGRSIGIIDGAPMRHLRPVGGSYDMGLAIEEGKALLDRFEVRRSRQEFFSGDRILIAA